MTARCRGVPIDKEDWAGCHADNPKGTITSVEMLKFIVLTVDRMPADLAADIKHAEESGSAK